VLDPLNSLNTPCALALFLGSMDVLGTGELSYGNVVLSCGVGDHVDLRGLPGGAEGIVRREIGKE
jgi:hypothetical protein